MNSSFVTLVSNASANGYRKYFYTKVLSSQEVIKILANNTQASYFFDEKTGEHCFIVY